jgi:hypothetical protein
MHAFEHARAVALELMQHREIKTRAWQLQVCDFDQKILCQLLFASLDPSMNAFAPPLRNSAEKVYGETAELNDALRNVQAPWFSSRTCSGLCPYERSRRFA